MQRFMKQIKCLKSSLQHCGRVRVYKTVDGADGESQIYVYFVILHNISINSLIFVYICFVDCCIAVSLQTIK